MSITPVCGVDFCDTCGDCLHCYGEDRCAHNADGEHMLSERMREAARSER